MKMKMMKTDKSADALSADDKLWLESLKATRSEYYEEVKAELVELSEEDCCDKLTSNSDS